MKVKRTIAYVRASTTEQAESGFTIDGQIRMIKNYAKKKGYHLEDNDIFVDAGKSGLDESRPAFDKMMEEVLNSSIGRIIIKKTDRLSRRIDQREYLMNLFHELGIVLEGVQESISWNTADERETARIKIVRDQAESERISERTKDGLLESARQGNYSISGYPFGYRKLEGKLVIYEEEALIVKDVFEKIIDGMTTHSIVVWFNDHYKEQKKWYKGFIENILRNKIYYGCMELNKNTNPICIENHSPAIVSKETFDQVQKILKRRSRVSRYTYHYSKKIRCSNCGNNCVCKPTRKKDKTMYYYYCCNTCKTRINQTVIDELVLGELQHKVIAETNEAYNNKLIKKHKRINRLVDIVTDLYVKGEIRDEALKDEILKNAKRIERLNKEYQAFHKKIGVNISKMSASQIAELVDDHIKNIVVDFSQKSVKIVYRNNKEEK